MFAPFHRGDLWPPLFFMLLRILIVDDTKQIVV